jgi:hypothetical protein
MPRLLPGQPSDEFRRLVETCLFGVVNLTRAALPLGIALFLVRHIKSDGTCLDSVPFDQIG